MATPSDNSLTVPVISKPRYSLKRRPSETLIRKSLRRASASSSNSLRPSINPVRKSIQSASNYRNKEFILHYNRYIHSPATIDSRHEEYYAKHGFPSKPRYNNAGRRFSDSTETDPDYDRYLFRKLAEQLNRKGSASSLTSDATTVSGASTGSKKMKNDRGTKMSAQERKRRSQWRSRLRRDTQSSGCLRSFAIWLRGCFCCAQPSEVAPSPYNGDNTRRSVVSHAFSSVSASNSRLFISPHESPGGSTE